MKLLLFTLVVFSTLVLTVGVSFGMSHTDYNDLDWQCKKAVGLVELAKQDYPHFEDGTLWIAEKHCGFNVDNITS